MDTSNRRRRARAAALHRGKPPTPPRSPSPTRSPFCRNSDTSLPLKRELLLQPSAELHVNAPKLFVVNRKETVPVNEDEQEEEDTPIPAWLSRLRDRRNHPPQHHHNTNTRPNSSPDPTHNTQPPNTTTQPLVFILVFLCFGDFSAKLKKSKNADRKFEKLTFTNQTFELRFKLLKSIVYFRNHFRSLELNSKARKVIRKSRKFQK